MFDCCLVFRIRLRLKGKSSCYCPIDCKVVSVWFAALVTALTPWLAIALPIKPKMIIITKYFFMTYLLTWQDT